MYPEFYTLVVRPLCVTFIYTSLLQGVLFEILPFLFTIAGFILGNLPQERRDEVSKDHVCGGEFKFVEP